MIWGARMISGGGRVIHPIQSGMICVVKIPVSLPRPEERTALPSAVVGYDGSQLAEAALPVLVQAGLPSTASPSAAVLSTSPCPRGAASWPLWDNCHRVICRYPATVLMMDLGAYWGNRSSRNQWFRQPARQSCHTALPNTIALAAKQKKELIFFRALVSKQPTHSVRLQTRLHCIYKGIVSLLTMPAPSKKMLLNF